MLCFLGAFSLKAQHVLIVEKGTPSKRLRHYQGDVLRYSTVQDDLIQTGRITKIDSQFVYFDELKVRVSQIDMVVKYRKLVDMFSTALIAAGLGYIGLDMVNQAVNSRKPIIDESVVKSGAIVSAVGLGLKFFSRRKIRIRGDTRIFVLNTNPK